ncbi:unnamed protein product [Paramecium octaurelia]|uniref:Uncharacterized protein n=1 Tax=Paramecium octaurelia TaxID=43137 RepID=A0A8S1Y5S4_PAROT|nr:unnamed protein product [Paramecium octaurelia]
MRRLNRKNQHPAHSRKYGLSNAQDHPLEFVSMFFQLNEYQWSYHDTHQPQYLSKHSAQQYSHLILNDNFINPALKWLILIQKVFLLCERLIEIFQTNQTDEKLQAKLYYDEFSIQQSFQIKSKQKLFQPLSKLLTQNNYNYIIICASTQT